MDHPVANLTLSGPLAKICDPKAPHGMKMMVADGLAPLPPTDLVTALYVLGFDSDEKLSGKARGTLDKMPENVLFGALDQIAEGAVLDGLARLLRERPDALQRIVLGKSALDETVVWIAGSVQNEKLLEVVSANEQRMLACPGIIEALYHNKAARMSTVDRAVELAVRNGVELTGIASYAQLKAALADELITEASDEPTPEDLAFRQTFDDEAWQKVDEKTLLEALEAKDEALETDPVQQEVLEQIEPVEQKLSQMSISAKIRIATLGSGSQRSVLIRDSNKLVIMAVVQSPGISESEIMQYSHYRSLPEEAVRYMASNREWTKHYQVKLNLVQNPRTPIEFSMRFIPHLRTTDIRSLERDKNVPQAIARAAKQLRTKRMA